MYVLRLCIATLPLCLQMNALRAFCEKVAHEQTKICKLHLDGNGGKKRKMDIPLCYEWTPEDVHEMVANYFRNYQYKVLGK